MCYSCLLRLTISKFVPRFPFISIAFFWHHLDQKRQPCICWQLQAFLSQHLRAQPSEYCMCEVSLALNVQKHVFATLFAVAGWTTSGWKWLVTRERSLGIYEALKCLVSREGGLAAVAQPSKWAGDRRRDPTLAQSGGCGIRQRCLKYLQ